MGAMNQTIIDYYRCPANVGDLRLAGGLSNDPGYFRFGSGTICYGNSASGFRSQQVSSSLYDVLADVRTGDGGVRLPMDPDEIIENLRFERYWRSGNGTGGRLAHHPWLRSLYYWLRPFLPVDVRKHLQRVHLNDWRNIPFPHWPVDRTVERILDRLLVLSMKAQEIQKAPFVWFWPEG